MSNTISNFDLENLHFDMNDVHLSFDIHTYRTSYFKKKYSPINFFMHSDELIMLILLPSKRYEVVTYERFIQILSLLQDYNQDIIKRYNFLTDNSLITSFLKQSENAIEVYPFVMHHLDENEREPLELIYQNYIQKIIFPFKKYLKFDWLLPSTRTVIENIIFHYELIN